MKIYTVHPDTSYRSVMAEGNKREVFSSLSDYANPLDHPKFPNFYIPNLKEKPGNFYSLGINSLLFDQKALEALKPSIELAGQLFPVSVEQLGTLTYCHLREMCDCLDEEKSKGPIHPATGTASPLKKFVFYPSKVHSQSGLFRIPQGLSAKIFAVTDIPSRNDDFYSLYQAAGLTGLEFRKVWSDEN